MVEQNFFFHSAIIIICDIKSGTNDTIEVTIVSTIDCLQIGNLFSFNYINYLILLNAFIFTVM